MRCTPDICPDSLIGSAGQASATGLSGLYDGAISHDRVTRLSTNSYLDAKDLWQTKPLIGPQARLPGSEFAVLIVDDSYAEKLRTDESAGLRENSSHRSFEK